MPNHVQAAAALITGCSSGIGQATALRLHAAGFRVYATARDTGSLADLAAAGIRTTRLDVTDEASMTDVISRITADHGAVGVLVNNAGFELAGPVEEVPLAEARRQFDTNFFGLARLTQLVIPGMRTKKFPAGEFGVPCALIIGQRTPSTDRKLSLNQALRDFAVPV